MVIKYWPWKIVSILAVFFLLTVYTGASLRSVSVRSHDYTSLETSLTLRPALAAPIPLHVAFSGFQSAGKETVRYATAGDGLGLVRGAATNATTASYPFYDGFESGMLGTDWTTYTTNDGRVQVGSAYPYSGTYGLLLDDAVNDTTYSYAAAILTIDLSGRSDVELDFWWQEFGYDRTDEGVYISDDGGGSWYQVMNFDADPTGWRHQIIDLDAAAAAAGMAFGADFRIKFQAYLDDPITYEGYAIDEVQVRPAPSPAPAAFPYYDGFESGGLGQEWVISFTNEGRVQVGPSYAYSGTYSLLLDDWSNDTIYSYAAAILAVDLDSGSQTELDFWWQEFGYDRTNEGVYISDDAGGTWYQVMDFDADPTGWQHEIIDLDEAAAAAGMTLGAGFRIKFQAYLDDPITYEGYAIDEIQVRENRAPALSWLGTGNYTDDGVHPESGDVADDYEYRIKYADPEGDPPAYVRVHIEEGGVDIPGSPFTLTDDGGDYTSGVSCSYVRSGLEEGDDYTYYFVAQDDQGKAASSTPRKTGPVATVTYWAYLPTFLKNIGPPTSVPVLYPISNPNGDYRFTITWSDVKKAARYTLEQDRDAGFSSPAVAYTGAATSTQVSVGDVGTYYYRVKASNSFGETDWSNTESVVVTVAPPPCPREGYWSGTTSQGKGIRFDVVYSPRCQVESLSITYRICGMTVTADFYEDYSITDDHFYVGGGDNWLSGDFASDTEANGSFFFEMMCPGFPPIPDFSDGTWTATFKP